MPNDPYHPRTSPYTDPETVAAWREYEAKSRAAADEYPARVRRNAYPGCAGGCERVVWAVHVVCVECKREGRG